MDATDELQKPAPDLWRLGAAASYVGLTPKQLATACRRKRIPVSLVELGPRSRYVRASEFNAWRATLRAGEPNLFT